MGTWGVGLYQDDTTADLKAEIREELALSESPEAAVAALVKRYRVPEVPEEADQSGFWLALADQLHAYGIVLPDVAARAEALIESGADLRLLEALEMSPKDLKARAKVLEGLRAKWAVPAEKPRKIPVLKPERLIMSAGDVFAYPTMDYNPRNDPYGTEEKKRYRFKPDRENAFVCMATGHAHRGLEARYFLVPLLLFYEQGPLNIRICLEGNLNATVHWFEQSFEPTGGWCRFQRKRLKMIEARKIGGVDPDIEAVRGVFGDTIDGPTHRHDTVIDPLYIPRSPFESLARGSIWGSHELTLETLVTGWNAA